MQGFNMGRYNSPASLDPSLSSERVGGFNKQNDQRPRAPDGSIVVRFEMPFKIWCSGCSPESVIDQGSRFNATKKQIGKFFTTPRYEFKMKHADCGKMITIETDPMNQTYKVVNGGRRADWEFKSLEEGGDVGEALDLENPKDGFAIQEAARYNARKNDPIVSDRRINELLKANEKNDNPYALNAQARKKFREGRWQRNRAQEEAEALGNRFGLPFEVLTVIQEDKDQARETVFGQKDAELVSALEERKVNARSIFDKTPIKTLVRPSGIKDEAWNKMKAMHNLKEAAKLQHSEKMLQEVGDWGTKPKKRTPAEILAQIVGRPVTVRKSTFEQNKVKKDCVKSGENVEEESVERPAKKARLVEYSDSDSEE
jgi:coiled-coil domain-containing protein 130